MNEEKKQDMPQRRIKIRVRDLLIGSQWPLLVRIGLRNWKRKTVPVGRWRIRFPTPVRVFSVAEEAIDWIGFFLIVFGFD